MPTPDAGALSNEGVETLKKVMSGLDRPLVTALKDILDPLKAAIAAIKARNQMISASLDIALAPLQAKRDLITEAINTAKEKTANVIPKEVIEICPPVGMLNMIVGDMSANTFEIVDTILFEIDRMLAEKKQLLASMAKLDLLTDFVESFAEVLDEVLAMAENIEGNLP